MTENTTPAPNSQPVVGPVERQVRPVAYLYHDADTPEDAHPWLHSAMVVLAADRRPTLRNETPLVPLAQAEAMVTAERERWAHVFDGWRVLQALKPDQRKRIGYADVSDVLDAVARLSRA